MSDKYSKRRAQSSSITTVVSISLVLFMLGLIGLLILNAKGLADHVKENIGIEIVLKDNATDAEIAGLQKTLDATDYVKTTEYITKEQAAEIMKEQIGEADFLDYNPLPASIRVHMRSEYANPDSLTWIEGELLKRSEIKEVWYQKNLIKQVSENVQKISLVILVFSSLLMIVALALVNNTIRLSIYSKRFLIKTMQLVGATQGFIRKPFVIQGIKHGVYSGCIAIIMLIGVLYIAQKQIPEIAQVQDRNTITTLFGLVILLGMVISGISTSLSVRKYLNLNTDDLYK